MCPALPDKVTAATVLICRRADPPDHGELCRARAAAAAGPGRAPADPVCLPGAVREQRSLRCAQGAAGRAGQGQHGEKGEWGCSPHDGWGEHFPCDTKHDSKFYILKSIVSISTGWQQRPSKYSAHCPWA